MDEVKRLYIWNETEPDGVNYFSMKLFKGWWYLRILRWMRMTTLRDFLMRWFYEPFYGVLFFEDFGTATYNTDEEEDKRMLISPPEERKRMRFGLPEEAKRLLVSSSEETKRQVIS